MVGKVDKDVTKCLELMKEIENEVARKKEASRRVKGLRETIGATTNDASDLEAQQQHLLRQTATLKDRIKKLESQAALKKDALASKIEEHLKDKEAVEAENACQAALAAQHEATVRVFIFFGGGWGGCYGAWGVGVVLRDCEETGGGAAVDDAPDSPAPRSLTLNAAAPLRHQPPASTPQIRSTQERARELSAVHAAAVGALLDKYAALRAEVDGYNAALVAAIRGGWLIWGGGLLGGWGSQNGG
jgi:hypothetical protein